jgi:O-antigen/teichoic acid export membrane protein
MIPTTTATSEAARGSEANDTSLSRPQVSTDEGGVGQKLISNTLFNFLGQLYVLVLGFAVVPYVVHRLGADLYGLIMLVAAVGGFAGLLNVGVGTALSKYVAELYWQRDFARISGLFQTAFAFALLAGSAACLILIAFRRSLSSALFHGTADSARFVAFALLVTAFGVLISMAMEPLAAIPPALQRFDVYNWVNILSSTFRNLGAVLVLMVGFFVRGVLVVYLLASLVVLIVYAQYARRLIPGLRLRPRLYWPHVKQLLGFSVYVIAASISALVVIRLDRVLVAYFLPIAAVAYYVVPYSLAERTWMGVANITSVIFPLASELSAMQAREKVRELYLRATKMVVLAGLPVTVVLLALPGQILHHWVGPDFAVRGALTLQLLAAGFFFNVLANVPFVVVQGIGRPSISAKYSLLNGAVNLVLFLLFIPRYGIVGAGVGFFVSELLVMPLFIWEVNRILDVSWASVAIRAYLRPLICGSVTFALLWICRSYADSLVKLIFLCGVALCAYGLVALAGAMDKRERTGIYQQIFRILRPARGAINV